MAIGRMVAVVVVVLLSCPAAVPGQSEWTLGDRSLTFGAWSFQRETEQRKMVAVVACWPGSEAWDWGLTVFHASWSAFRSGTVRVRAATERGSSIVRFAHGVVPGVLETGVPSTVVRDVFFAGPRLFLHVEPVGRPGTDMDVLDMSGLREAVLAADTDCDVPVIRSQTAELAFGVSGFLLSVVGWAAPLLLVGLVLSIFRRTRPWIGFILWVFSCLLGAATWFWGAALTFSGFGWIGVWIGLVVGGVGVVPVGIFAAYMHDAPDASVTLFLMVVGTFALWGIGMWLMAQPPPQVSESPASYV